MFIKLNVVTLYLIFLKQNPPDNGSLFTSEGLQVTGLDDLENIFENDSSDETEGVSFFIFPIHFKLQRY